MISVKSIKWRQYFCGGNIMLLYSAVFVILNLFVQDMIASVFLCLLCLCINPSYTFVIKKYGNSTSLNLGIISVGLVLCAVMKFTEDALPLTESILYGKSPCCFLLLMWCVVIIYTKLMEHIEETDNKSARYCGIIYAVMAFIPVVFLCMEGIVENDDLGMWAILIMMLVMCVFYLSVAINEGEYRTFSLTIIAYLITFTAPAAACILAFCEGWSIVFYVFFMPLPVVGLPIADNVMWFVRRLVKRKAR